VEQVIEGFNAALNPFMFAGDFHQWMIATRKDIFFD
jgi:hypothetical protein